MAQLIALFFSFYTLGYNQFYLNTDPIGWVGCIGFKFSMCLMTSRAFLVPTPFWKRISKYSGRLCENHRLNRERERNAKCAYKNRCYNKIFVYFINKLFWLINYGSYSSVIFNDLSTSMVTPYKITILLLLIQMSRMQTNTSFKT